MADTRRSRMEEPILEEIRCEEAKIRDIPEAYVLGLEVPLKVGGNTAI